MYILLVGEHPLYKTGEETKEYIARLENISWTFPKQFTDLAKDFFLKLMKTNPFERYIAKEALSHPWITRVASKIPLSYAENIAYEKSRTKVLNVD